ncbi:Silent information regulator protein Sir2 [Denitrovibrio acetiphilus DSM 12809]|uniref:protein acetyllysine N-acetyltransferase n=2 Tax=Denitrovibrio TaxID=117999 RepID=D4H6A5_DENA2|nr:Silent information regulator protein Sir2 [Denitrovibrio acetiphilus DSM 12809]
MNMDNVRKLARLIADNPYNVFFTGAGASTESGIPDYRSEGSGLWNRIDSSKLISLKGFLENPKGFYEVFSGGLFAPFAHAEPNVAHMFIAMLEEQKASKAVITQNIDGLHRKAGSFNICELHGSMETSSCIICGKSFSTAEVFDKFMLDGATPECTCGNIVKPDIVFFGESLPKDVLEESFELAAGCTLMIVAGSSLEVMPANLLPKYAKDHGALLVIINKTETPLDYTADIVINKGIGEVFTELNNIWKTAE